jgi:hypothetical protein
VCIENPIRIDCVTESPKTSSAMVALLSSFLILLASPFSSEQMARPKRDRMDERA